MQGLEATVTWKQCTGLPTDFAEGQSLVVGNKIYCGGSTSTTNEYTVYSYDPQKDKWSILPPLFARYFGLGQINGELVAVGGVKKHADVPTNEVHKYDASLDRWKQMIAETIPTARAFPGVMSVPSGLIVAGGLTELYDDEYTDVVEIFQLDTSQWYKPHPLPRCYSYLSTVSIGNMCYVFGECKHSDQECTSFPKAFCAPVDNLIRSTIPTMDTGSYFYNIDDAHTVWKTLPNTPAFQPVAASLDDHLLAIGGWQTSRDGARMKEVYAFSPSMSSWVYVSNLPAPRTNVAVAVMTKTEILVIGGHGGDDDRVSTVYKGTLNLKL